jgi:hypothetical protein
MTRGFAIMAQNTDKTDYVKCAKALELSIKQVMPNANVTIITTDMLPHGDQAPNSDWKLINDWQVYEASPYDETIKLEADMFLPRSIEHWFDILSINDVTLCTKIRNYKGEISNVRVYRKFIDDNNLPDVYNAITYFKKSDTAERFYAIVRDVFENWEEYKAILKCNPTEEATTDWVYAIASHIIGVEKTTLPNFNELSMTHMKQFISSTATENWTDTLVYELLPDVLRVHTYSQEYPFHYHSKSFSDKILERYKWNTL